MSVPVNIALDGRFVVRRELGRGASSVVWQVLDQLHDVERAVKLSYRARDKRRYRNEFRCLTEFRHPNIVRAYDTGVTDTGLPYVVMELIHGISLANFPERQDAEALAVVAMQVLDALATLHARGVVHRDLKPRNILVAGRGSAAVARLIDFGLTCQVGEARPAAGTLPYMAPEVARGAAVDGRADLYSLGMVLYEALLPDHVARTVEDVAQGLAQALPEPSAVNPVISSGLSSVVMRLLAADPEARFASAYEAADALSRLPDLRLGRGPERAAAERLMRGGAVSHRKRLVRKVLQISKKVRDAQHGQLLLVEGPTGAGKTPFLRELAAELSLQGFRVGRFITRAESASPIPALLQAAQRLQPAATTVALWPVSSPMRVGPAEVARFAGQMAVALVEGLGTQPTALIIDDLHRAEPVAFEVLRSLADELGSVPLLLVAAGDPRPEGAPIAELLGGQAIALELTPLSTEEVAALAAHRLHGLALPPPALLRISEDSQGMPSLVERTLARLYVEGTIRREGQGFGFVGGRYRAARHADSDLLAARIDQVAPDHRFVLHAAAVLAHGINASAIAGMMGAPKDTVATILAELCRREILMVDDAGVEPSYEFATRGLIGAVYQRIVPAARRELHTHAARLLKGLPYATGRAEERVEHLFKGNNDQEAIAAAVEAGDRAASVFADRRAIEYYARAFARLPEGAYGGAAIALKLGRLFARTGELERAESWYDAARNTAQSHERVIQAEALLGLGDVAWLRGQPTDTEAHAEAALALLHEQPEPRLAAVGRRLLAVVAAQAGDSERAEQILLEVLAELDQAHAETEAIAVLIDLARLARRRSELVRGARYARLAQQRARAHNDFAALAEASTVLGRSLLLAARFDAARNALTYALRVARAAGDRLRQGLVLREIGNLKIREGDLVAALERYERSLELTRACRARADESACLHNIGMVRAKLGDFGPAIAALTTALELCHGVGDVQGTAATAVELGHTYALLGDLVRARQHLHAARETGEIVHDDVTVAEASALLAWVEAREGQFEAGTRFLDELERTLALLEDPADQAMVLCYAVRTALLVGRPGEARRWAPQFLELTHTGSLGDLQALAEGLLGAALVTSGEVEAGLEKLGSAVAAAERANLRPLAVELRGWLGRQLSGSDRGVEHLTRGMEQLETLVAALPGELALMHLKTAESHALRTAFDAERQRLVTLGVLH